MNMSNISCSTKAKIVFKNVSKTFIAKREGSKLLAVDDISFEVKDKEFICLVGTSGCGKSTLINLIAGFERPNEGQVFVDGEIITGPTPDRGMVFQENALFHWLTVFENVCFGPKQLKILNEGTLLEITKILEQMGLSNFMNSYPNELSGGMRQRVAIARALINQPSILLLDEPFGALDSQTRLIMQELLINVWERNNRTMIFITHDVDEAIFMADRVLVMSKRPGKIIADIKIGIERPRHHEMITSPEFMAIKREVLSLVRKQSLEIASSEINSE